MRVPGTESHQQSDGLTERLNALARAVSHIRDGLPVLCDGVGFGSVIDEDQDHVIVAALCGVMKRSEALVVR